MTIRRKVIPLDHLVGAASRVGGARPSVFLVAPSWRAKRL
jgi:hypothetical protein